MAAGETVIRLVLESKWGFDGSSSHSKYKQKTRDEFTDGSVFMSCLVRLRLFQVWALYNPTLLPSASTQSVSIFFLCLQESTGDDGEDPRIHWLNVTPSSTRFCRLIHFEFTKETDEKSILHFDAMQADIDALKETKVTKGNVTFVVQHRLFPCMVDGKICSALSSTSSSRCHVCGAYSIEMNDLNALAKRKASKNTYKFGLSPLHFRIRYTKIPFHEIRRATLLTYCLSQGSWNDPAYCISSGFQTMETRFWSSQGSCAREERHYAGEVSGCDWSSCRLCEAGFWQH